MQRFGKVLCLRDVSERNIAEATAWLDGYTKFTSMAWIRALRQPILDGIIVKRWSQEAESALQAFCVRHNRSDVMLRVDMANQRWSKRRGGYIIPVSKARAALRELNKEGRIAAFLEPLSPYRDQYCLAAVTDERQERMTVEVVGPGFDTSDLLRSDTQPHERFDVLLPETTLESFAISARRTFVVTPEHYPRSVEQRLVKIGARLKNPAYPEVILGSKRVRRGRLAQDAKDFLARTRQTLLLKHLDAYLPIPRRCLVTFVVGANAILRGLKRHEVQVGAIAVSGTFTLRGRFLFWDFFPADLAEAKALTL